MKPINTEKKVKIHKSVEFKNMLSTSPKPITNIRREISEILIKWNMSTRQVAINELVALFPDQQKLIEHIKGMRRTVKYKKDGGCVNCGWTKSGCVCSGYNTALNDILSYLEREF